ncbi:DnaB-like helicase C-terminal domain-containing protein [Ectothiorhodospira shaposhnikovii]|uniref:DnaB-like helicase C-terminal domain-containing protein n=1 Tax=Ectothiorhodospira shaposhnikovii TaxID=1054 RepID=UPI001EE83823|nr:DnaB-like helicase C-terminal domain-containing protein [Ectothiorhodospira shaposhnikovii]MCG5512877.1 AAA family ATPase [Ectothiorhodospira shaposhnikovii]
MAVTEESLAKDIAARFEGTATATAPAVSAGDWSDNAAFEFDSAFQTKIAALAVKDPIFVERTDGLVRPEYFENVAEAALVSIALRYYGRYRRLPDTVTLMQLVKDDLRAKVIRPELLGEVKTALKRVLTTNIDDRDYVVDQVATFARHQAISGAILTSVDLLGRGDHARILELVRKATEVGAADFAGQYDYAERIDQRAELRRAEAAGEIAPRGISTGVRALDKLLKHKGWGRRELSLLMGGPKVGKSTGLAMFAKNAWLQGCNVLFVTLEVSNEILSDRLDACIAEVPMSELSDRIIEVQERIKLAAASAGKLMLHEYPTGTFTSAMLKRLIARYKAQGIRFDMVVVDYADIMAPNRATDDPRENSKSIYVDLRAIAQEEDLAMLSATQTNREGAKSIVAGMTHVAEDFNKIRIADIVISINKTEEEEKRGEARLFFAASRNQKGGMTLRIQQDLESMIFVKRVTGIE